MELGEVVGKGEEVAEAKLMMKQRRLLYFPQSPFSRYDVKLLLVTERMKSEIFELRWEVLYHLAVMGAM